MVETLKLSKEIEAKPLEEWESITVELLGTQTRLIQGKRWRHRVIECGEEGEPLFLLHGIGGHAETYARNMHNLANNGFHVYAVDELYHGFTDKEPYDEENRIQLAADAVADLVEALGHERVHIEGESLGAAIALDFAMRYPQLCGKLILNTAAIHLVLKLEKTDFIQRPGGGSTLQELSVKSVVNPTYETVRARMEWLVASPDRITDELVKVRLRLYGFKDIYESMQKVYGIGRSWPANPKYTEEDVQKLEAETLVFWTDKNPGTGPDVGEYIASVLPNAKFYNMEDAAHWPQWEKPEEHDQVLIDFILPKS